MHFRTKRIRSKERFSTTSAFLVFSLVLQVLFPFFLPSSALANEKWVTPLVTEGNNSVRALALEGTYLWAGTDGGGVVRWNLATMAHTEYTTANSGLASNTVRSIAVDSDNNKWFGTDAGVSMLNGADWTTYDTSDGLADNSVYAITIDSGGNKWFGTNGGVSKLDNAGWTTYATYNSGLTHPYVRAIAIDSGGNKWFGTLHGLSKLDAENHWETYKTENGLADNCVYSIAFDTEGNKWFGTFNGVSKFDGTNWTSYYKPDLTDNTVYSIAIDSAGNKWFGTHDNGITKFDGTNWIPYNTVNTTNLPHNRVNSVVTAAGDTWFGTEGGIGGLITDNDPPLVSSTNPADSASGASISANITATFSEEMNQSTIGHANFFLKDSGDNYVPGDVTYPDPSTRTIIFNPHNNLEYTATYQATITTGVKDIAGNYMALDKVWSFTTEDPPDIASPSKPTTLTASAISTSQINLSWTASTDTGGSGLAGYEIERASDLSGSPGVFSEIGISSNNSYSDSGLTPNTTYWYKVSAYDNASNDSGSSDLASATTLSPPPPPPPPPASITPEASTTWYFAEGYTAEGFDTWLTLQNPNAEAATVTVTYMYRDGTTKTTAKNVAATSRETVDVNADAGSYKEVSIKVESNKQIVAERPMYFNCGGQTGGDNTIGYASP